jgi:polyisoprenoid-binding protein YceI
MKKSLLLASGLGLLLVIAACSKASDGAAAATPSLPVAVIAAEAAVAAGAADATAFSFDPSSSTIGYTGKKITGSHSGRFGAFTGEVRVGKDPASSGVTLAIDMGSITSDNEKLTGHLKSAEFFDVATFPQATFASTSITADGTGGATHTVRGNLTLHGVTKNVAFPATLQTSAERVNLKASFSLDRKAFQINYPGRADDLISDLVDLSLDITATPKPAAAAAAEATPPAAAAAGSTPPPAAASH